VQPDAAELCAPLPADEVLAGPRRRVVVAMSGGVDSSVVAGLLKEAGHDVIGITLQLYNHGAATGRKGSCCAGQDIHDARQVAQSLEIPHYVLDYEERFSAAVIGEFAASYAAGETPIPCVTCNSQIKFGDLLDTARSLDAEIMATGHYVRRRTVDGAAQLLRARDTERDQSYFLFATTREQLAHLWFPLGGLTKAEVRGHARRLGIPVADKADSQDICFVPTGRYTAIVEKLKPEAARPGNIVHIDGRILGRHEGIINYTVGQRRGLGIAGGEPLFVLRLDAAKNEVVVGPRDFLRTAGLVVRNVNWLAETGFTDLNGAGLSVHVRLRSTQTPRPAVLSPLDNGTAEVVLTGGDDGVAAGQACVFYDSPQADARVLGGGWIQSTFPMRPAA
jgi:tRNA-specific 2-thiouridylase